MNTEKYRDRERERHRGGHTDRQIDGRERERDTNKERYEYWEKWTERQRKRA
jgi:hypothetical protein